MTRDDTLALLRDVLQLPPDFQLTDGHSPTQVPGWDSVGWLNLLLAIEDRMGMPIPIEDLDKIFNFGDLCRVTRRMADGD